MSRSRTVFALASALALFGCAGGSGPIWLDASKIDMEDYRQARIVVLPAENNPLYKIDEGQLRAIQEHVRSNMKRVFGLENIESLPAAERRVRYPYTLADVGDLAGLYYAEAAVGVSVYWFRKYDQFGPESLGIKIIFADASDPNKGWIASRDHTAEFEYLATSPVLGDSIYIDLRAVETALQRGSGFTNAVARTASFGLLGRESTGPKLSVVSPELNAGPSKEIGGTIETNLSGISLQISAQDDDGIERIRVRNKDAGFENVLGVHVHDASPEVKQQQQVYKAHDGTLANEFVWVPIEEGRNEIDITAYNTRHKRTVREMTVLRTVSRDVYSLSVGVGEFEYFKDSLRFPQESALQFDAAAGDGATESFLLHGYAATRRELLRGIKEISDRLYSNDSSIGVFYFAGYHETVGGQDFLVTSDYIDEYPTRTGVSIDFVAENFPDDSYVVFDLCGRGEAVPGVIEDRLPGAIVSYDNCSDGQDTLADRIARKVGDGHSFRDALEAVSREQAAVAVE